MSGLSHGEYKVLYDSTGANSSLVFKMMARNVFQMLTLLILFQAGNVVLSANINRQCDLGTFFNRFIYICLASV